MTGLPISQWPTELTDYPADWAQYYSPAGDNVPGNTTEKALFATWQRLMQGRVATVAALRSLSATTIPAGSLLRTDGHTNAGAGAGTFRLVQGGVGANQDNNATRIAANGGPGVGDPNAWYWVRVEDGNEDDCQVWGVILGTNIANAVPNDQALFEMVTANQNIYFPGPVVVSKSIILNDKPLTLYGNNPNIPGAGGLLVTGVDTAQNTAIIDITNNRGHVIKDLRFYGHADSQSAASTVCTLGIRIRSDSGQSVQYLGSHWEISNCVFEREVPNTTPFTVIPNFAGCIELSAIAADANADQGIIYNCRFRNWTGNCINIPNSQSVNVEIQHCLFDTQLGQHTDYRDAVGIRSFADIQVLNCSFNRMGTVIQGSSASHIVLRDFHIENANMIFNAASESCWITLRDGKFIWQENAYSTASGIWLRFLNGQCLRIIVDNVWFADQTGAATRPHAILASRATGSQGRSLFSFTNNRGLNLDDIDAESPVGIPSQQLRRLSENDKGVDFRWENNEDRLIFIARSLDQNRLNLD